MRADRDYRGGVTDREQRAMSFGSIAEDYDGLRPQPPQQAVDWLVPPGCGVAVDLGQAYHRLCNTHKYEIFTHQESIRAYQH